MEIELYFREFDTVGWKKFFNKKSKIEVVDFNGLTFLTSFNYDDVLSAIPQLRKLVLETRTYDLTRKEFKPIQHQNLKELALSSRFEVLAFEEFKRLWNMCPNLASLYIKYRNISNFNKKEFVALMKTERPMKQLKKFYVQLLEPNTSASVVSVKAILQAHPTLTSFGFLPTFCLTDDEFYNQVPENLTKKIKLLVDFPARDLVDYETF